MGTTHKEVFMQPIETKRTPDEEGDHNRGWQVDLLEASIGGVQVGYIKMAYIPRKRFKDHYAAGVLSYMDRIQGHGLFERPDDRLNGRANHNIAGFTDEQLRTFVRRAAFAVLHKDYSMSDALTRMARSELLSMVRQIDARAEADHGAKFKAFKAYHLDMPEVAFIHVEELWRRRGIAMSLYAEGARWMDSLGMKLHASSTQTDPARAAWVKLEREGWTTIKGKRRFLDVAKIDEAVCA